MAFFRSPGGLPYPVNNLVGALSDTSSPLVLREALVTNTPAIKRVGAVDLICNLLVTTLAVTVVSLPPGQQATASAPATRQISSADEYVQPLTLQPLPVGRSAIASAPITKYQVVADQYPNVLVRGIPAPTLPAVVALSASAPITKYQVIADQYQNFLVLGYPNAALRTPLVFNCPQVKAAVQVDVFPNLVVGTASPTVPAVQSSIASAPITKSTVIADQYVNTLVLGYPTFMPAWADFDSAPSLKFQPFADQFINTLVLQPLPPLPKVRQQTDSAPPPKYQPQVDVYPNLVIKTTVVNNPAPRQQTDSAPVTKFQVTAEQYINQLVRGYPAARPFSQTDWTQTFHSLWQPGVDLVPNVTLLYLSPLPTGPGSGLKRRGGRVILPVKKLSETSIQQIDFISQLGASETIVSAVCTCTVYEGIDSNPSAMISGSTTITGTIVNQQITGGVLGTIYELLTKATTSLGQILPLTAYLAVVPDLP